MVQLRSYQETLLRLVQNALAADPKARVMMQLPTGGGKTVIAGALLTERFKSGRKAVWLTHRKELAEQTRRMLTDAHVPAMTDVRWNPGTDAPAMAGGAVILMAQTVGRRNGRTPIWGRYTGDDLLVIDEAHHAAAAGWERAIRQWPGPVVGMTATPWRLSEKEGFDHLFDNLLSGPQVADLQTLGWLCRAQVIIPSPEQNIIGGTVDRTGDYTETGIEQANQDRPDVMTAGVLEFWQKHAGDRPTIAYAVSVDHAYNLIAVFNGAGIPAAVILGDSNREDRDNAIAGFKDGAIKVLVNVLVATEGFDLPDASCIIITRPTMSLALYLQMAGRGLRPKEDGGDCRILDLAYNAVTHGLPEDYREWSLEPSGSQKSGVAPVIRCPQCESVSPAASHQCRECGYVFGKDCNRCGKWRSWKRWGYEDHCGDAHQTVCDLCHIDAHIQAHLPVVPPLDELVDLHDPEDGMPFRDDLASRLAALLKELLEQERHEAGGANEPRCTELRRLINCGEEVLNDDYKLDVLFRKHIDALPEEERPKNPTQERRLHAEWESSLQSELGDWRVELSQLERQPVNTQLVFDSAKSKTMRLLYREAQAAGLLPPSPPPDPMPPDELTKVRVFLKSKNIIAEADFYGAKRVVVLADSVAAAAKNDRYEDICNLQNELVATRILLDDGQHRYKFTSDWQFGSPSQAAGAILGYPANGWLVWKDTNGVSLRSAIPRASFSHRGKVQS